MSAIAWMCCQAAQARALVPQGPRSRTALHVRRLGGDVVPLSQAQNELREGILDVLRGHGTRRIAEIRPMLSTGFFVGETPQAQAAEISGALKALHRMGDVSRSDVMPYFWSATAR